MPSLQRAEGKFSQGDISARSGRCCKWLGPGGDSKRELAEKEPVMLLFRKARGQAGGKGDAIDFHVTVRKGLPRSSGKERPIDHRDERSCRGAYRERGARFKSN